MQGCIGPTGSIDRNLMSPVTQHAIPALSTTNSQKLSQNKNSDGGVNVGAVRAY
jgi:hypothetical protein